MNTVKRHWNTEALSARYPRAANAILGENLPPQWTAGDEAREETQRTLAVLTMGAPLRDYAVGFQSDINAAFLLVHHAMVGALKSNDGRAPAPATEMQLRDRA